MPPQNSSSNAEAAAAVVLPETVNQDVEDLSLQITPQEKEGIGRSFSYVSGKDEGFDGEPQPKLSFCQRMSLAFTSFWVFLKTRTLKQWAIAGVWLTLLLGTFYIFMVSIKLLSEAFKVLTGCGAASMFDWVNNPVTGLMVGAVTTALIQSSSTTTSIIVSLVDAGVLSVHQASPIIMGANMGTTVTSTLAACAQITDDESFERAFAAGTVHDMFNILSIAVLFPLEVITYAFENLSEAVAPSPSDGEAWKSPISKIISPLSDLILKANKSELKAIATGEQTCADYETLISESFMLDWGWSDTAIGIVVLIGSLVVLFFTLWFLVQLLKYALLSSVKTVFEKAKNINSYILMLFGLGVTIMVQSSSITTSVVTSFAGLGMVNLEQSFAVVCGANVGTTTTALMAAMVSGKSESVQIALHHVFFNVAGVIIWFPIPWMRQWPMKGARAMGWMARRWKLTPVVFILTLFGVIPAIFIPMSLMFADGGILILPATIMAVAVAVFLAGFLFFYYKRDGKQRIMDWFDRKHAARLAKEAEAEEEQVVDEALDKEKGMLDNDALAENVSHEVASAV